MLGGRLKIGSDGRAGLQCLARFGFALLSLVLFTGCSRTHTLRLDGDGICRAGSAVVRVEHMALCNSDSPKVLVTLRNLGSDPIGLNYRRLSAWLFTINTEEGKALFRSKGILVDPSPADALIDHYQPIDEVILPGSARELAVSSWLVSLPDDRFQRGARLYFDRELDVRVGASGAWTSLPCIFSGQLE